MTTMKIYIFLSFVLACAAVDGAHEVSKTLTGIYWGAFDPPTEAHAAIIAASINDIPLKKLIVVVNNHSYKNYTYSLDMRLQMMKNILQKYDPEKIELRWQDDAHPVNFQTIAEVTKEPLCTVSGYDSYKKWTLHAPLKDRSCYEAIAVVPRGDDDPVLFDKNAFILPIDAKYKDVSSTKIREAALLSPKSLKKRND